MKVTLHSGRNGLAAHNDRSAGIGEHVDTTRSHENFYVDAQHGVISQEDVDLKDTELQYYRAHYQAAIDATNKGYIEHGHPEKVTTVEKLYNASKTRPQETILQIGKTGDTVDRDMLLRCMADYVKWINQWSKAHGDHIHLLDVTLHMDEETPHIHARKVYDYIDKNGNLHISQRKALEESGIERPNPQQPEDRHNCAIQTFTAIERSAWQQICISHGLEIDIQPEGRKKHKRTQHRDELDHEIAIKEAQRDKLDRDIQAKEEHLDELDKAVRDYEKAHGTLEQIKASTARILEKAANIKAVAKRIEEAMNDGLAMMAAEAMRRLDYLDRINREDPDLPRDRRGAIMVDEEQLPTNRDAEIAEDYEELSDIKNRIDDYDWDDEWER